MFGIFKKKPKETKVEVNVIEAGVRTKVFESAIESEAIEFLERNMHATSEISVIETGLRQFGKVIVTLLLTGKIVEVRRTK